MKLVIRPYTLKNSFSKELAERLDTFRLKVKGSSYLPNPKHLVVNWGSSRTPDWAIGAKVNWLNNPDKVGVAINKLTCLNSLSRFGVSCLDYTESHDKAKGWVEKGFIVIARTTVTGSRGEGCIVVRPGDKVPIAPLYTKYIEPDAEYRVHVLAGKVIDYTEKKRRNGWDENPNFSTIIRSWGNGWVFCRKGVRLPKCVEDEAIKAVEAVGLDFGGVDIVFSHGKAYILEINTAPALEGTTMDHYVEALKELSQRVEV